MVRLHITFLHFTARNRCGAYNPVTPDISFWLVRTKTTVLKIVTLLAKSTPDLFKLTWIGPFPLYQILFFLKTDLASRPDIFVFICLRFHVLQTTGLSSLT